MGSKVSFSGISARYFGSEVSDLSQYQERLSSYDLFLELEAFSEGRSTHAYRCFGAHPARDENGTEGWLFRVWAPNAPKVSIIGDFNSWKVGATPMEKQEGGIWQAFVPGLKRYDSYQYAIEDGTGGFTGKADPFAFHAATRPDVSSKIYDMEDPGYEWGDAEWLKFRAKHLVYHQPMNIYECHLGSWRKTGEGTFLSYRDIAGYLVPYVKNLGFTHVEFLPLTEHPLDASWGYQCTGYFAATSRYGIPEDLKYLIDQLHQAGIGVIMDWVPAHFPKDIFGLRRFDGGPTYEYADPQKGEHPEWGTCCFDLGRSEVRSFLFSSATYWLEEFHLDGLRVDAVSSMLYLNYARKDGEWTPNIYGGDENLEAVEFLQKLNTAIFAAHPDVLMVAEEATAWPGVTKPVDKGGLGFNFKWNMGWMNDICHYIKMDPYFRQFNHKDITFSMMYAFSENFILPLSHDEVVHMKGSLFGKMPGDDAMKFAGVRAFYTYMLTHPGKKLIFMGAEIGQWNEWHYEYSLDWHLLEIDRYQRHEAFFKAANAMYLNQPALWEEDDSWDGFKWLAPDDASANTIAYTRWDSAKKPLIVVCNFSPVHRQGYRVGAPFAGTWAPVFNTDLDEYGGQNLGDKEPLKTEKVACHGQDQSLVIDLPPMAVMIYRCTRRAPVRRKSENLLNRLGKGRKNTQESSGSEAPAKPAKAEKPAKAPKTPRIPKAEKPEKQEKTARPVRRKREPAAPRRPALHRDRKDT